MGERLRKHYGEEFRSLNLEVPLTMYLEIRKKAAESNLSIGGWVREILAEHLPHTIPWAAPHDTG